MAGERSEAKEAQHSQYSHMLLSWMGGVTSRGMRSFLMFAKMLNVSTNCSGC